MITKDEVLRDVFTTAVEGGVNYWFDVKRYEWRDIDSYVAVGTVPDEGDKVYTIDRDVISRGIHKAYANRDLIGPKYIKQAISDLNYGHWDDVDYDAEVADIIVQWGLLGEWYYG